MTEHVHGLRIQGLPVAVTRKPIRHMYLRLSRQGDAVRISAPMHVSDWQIDAFVQARAEWIRCQVQKHADRPSPESALRDGAVHPVWGQPHVLTRHVIDTRRALIVRDGRMILHMLSDDDDTCARAQLDAWYTQATRREALRILPHWEQRLDVHVDKLTIRHMRTRWGSCTPGTRRIRLNAALSKVSPALLECVLVHELVHLYERGHGPRFKALMDAYLPDWRQRDHQLKNLSFQVLSP